MFTQLSCLCALTLWPHGLGWRLFHVAGVSLLPSVPRRVACVCRECPLTSASVSGTCGTSSPNDVVVVSALRTPICKGRRGELKDTTPDLLLISVLKATMERTGVDPALIGDIVVGNNPRLCTRTVTALVDGLVGFGNAVDQRGGAPCP